MEKKLLNIGFGNTLVAERVVAIVSPSSSPMKRLKDEARKERHLVDATMDSNHIVLSAIQIETVSQRFEDLKSEKG